MNRRMLVGITSAVALSLALVACGKSSNPASPSSSSSASVGQAGATISGSVSGSTTGSSAGYQKLDTGNGITVTISGTSVTVAADSQGKFTFTGVPAGTITLVFSGGGGTATVTLNGIQSTDKITIHVTLKGGTATLDTEQRNGSSVTELEDRITAIPSAGTLLVGSTQVNVAGATIRHGDTTIAFTALKVGDRVHVRGTLTGTTMVATEIIVQNTNANVPVNASGTVSGWQKLGGGCPTIQFVVEGWTVQTNSSTDFQKGACSTIANGSSVHVKGDVLAGTPSVVIATWVQGK